MQTTTRRQTTPILEMSDEVLIARFEIDVLALPLGSVKIQSLESYLEMKRRGEPFFKLLLIDLETRREMITDPKVSLAWQHFFAQYFPQGSTARKGMPEIGRYNTGKSLIQWVYWARRGFPTTTA